MMADRHGDAAAARPRGPSASPFMRWTHQPDSEGSRAPAARSGHAMTLLKPTESVLVFGGSNGKVFFDDFHVLEPTQYAAPDAAAAAKKRRLAKGKARTAAAEGGSATSTPTLPQLIWKKLVVSKAIAYPASFLASSFGSEGSTDSPRGPPTEEIEVGCGRDYITMHYVASPDEKTRGQRVLVVGNVVVSPGADDGHSASASQPLVFDMETMRVDEVRVKQPLLEAQWVPRTIQSMWKPRARNAHCSALVGEQLFCFGGRNAGLTVYYNDLFYFDVALNQWREPKVAGSVPPPRACADMAVSATREQLFLYGGHDSAQQFAGLYMYDVHHSRWDKLAAHGDKPGSRLNHTLTFVAPHHLLLFGGRKRTSRRNELYLFDLSTQTWKLLGMQRAATAAAATAASVSCEDESQCENAAASEKQVVLTQSSVSSVTMPAAASFPSIRTAHCTVLYERAKQDPQQIIVFGGYAGAHSWLGDLQILELVPTTLRVDAVAPSQPTVRARDISSTPSSSSRELTTTHGPSPASHSSGSANSHTRSSSRSSVEGSNVLTDITNITTAHSSQGVETPAPTSFGYTPAAVAARRRRLAEMESKAESPGMHKKRRRNDDSGSLSASQSLSQSQSQRDHQRLVAPASQREVDSLSPPDVVGLQTTMIQLLQQQQRMDQAVARLAAAVRDDQTTKQRDAFVSQQVFMQKQNEQLENKLDAMTRRYELMVKKVESLEREKQAFQEQRIAAETEIYIYKKHMEELAPKLGAQVFEAIEKASRSQFNATHLIEAKISSIHDLLEDIRHSSGERTETDDSPNKKDSMFSEDSSSPHATQTHAPAVLYPQTIVRELEHKLHDVVQENRVLHSRVAMLEDKLKKADGNAQRIQELSMAWLRYQEEEEEVKGECA